MIYTTGNQPRNARKPRAEGADLLADQRGSGYTAGRVDAVIRFTKKTMVYTGRAIEEGTIRLKRLDNGFWEPDLNELTAHIHTVLANQSLTTMGARAAALSTLTHKTEEACRSALRRALVTI